MVTETSNNEIEMAAWGFHDEDVEMEEGRPAVTTDNVELREEDVEMEDVEGEEDVDMGIWVAHDDVDVEMEDRELHDDELEEIEMENGVLRVGDEETDMEDGDGDEDVDTGACEARDNEDVEMEDA
jgi:hypothetical protein